MDDQRLRALQGASNPTYISCFLGANPVWGSMPLLTFNNLLTRHLSTVSLFIQLNLECRRLLLFIAHEGLQTLELILYSVESMKPRVARVHGLEAV